MLFYGGLYQKILNDVSKMAQRQVVLVHFQNQRFKRGFMQGDIVYAVKGGPVLPFCHYTIGGMGDAVLICGETANDSIENRRSMRLTLRGGFAFVLMG